jgi:Domain of unknown function (DUF397)
MEAIGNRWRKSSYSGNGGECIEVADHANRVLVRDTKDRTGPVLKFSPNAWRRFAAQVKRSLASGSNGYQLGHSRFGQPRVTLRYISLLRYVASAGLLSGSSSPAEGFPQESKIGGADQSRGSRKLTTPPFHMASLNIGRPLEKRQ